MNPETPSKSSDPQGLRVDLRQALTLAERNHFDDEPGRRAAYQLAAALGRCRLFGVDAGEDDETLSVPMALAAVQQWLVLVAQWRQQTDDLPARWDASSSEIEADSLSFDLLEARMETWAVFIAIDEAFEDCLQTGDPGYANFVERLDQMMSEIDKLDAALRPQMSFLCVAAQTRLLENWRRWLAPMYRETLPWWLDGTLEDVLKNLHQAAWDGGHGPKRNIIQELVQEVAPNHSAYAIAAASEPTYRLTPKGVQLIAAVFRAEGDDCLQVGFDLTIDSGRNELRIYLSPPEAAARYRSVHFFLGKGAPRVCEVFADFASVPLESAALDLLTARSNGTICVELLTIEGIAPVRNLESEA